MVWGGRLRFRRLRLYVFEKRIVSCSSFECLGFVKLSELATLLYWGFMMQKCRVSVCYDFII
jgi:hypothetical protein